MGFWQKVEPGRHGYVSELDRLLLEFNERRTEVPPSIQYEIEKHKKIFEARDNPIEPDLSGLWE